MKIVRQIVTIIAVVCIILANVALPASAVDPVSTATMANALAQAITAYGASHGVSMTFDVANTNGIGEGMHKLWNDFKTYVNDNNVPTYDSLANTMWASIYTKIGNFVGININDTEIPFIDAFWDWLLTGPAEMTKVDNEYFQFANSTPIVVLTTNGWINVPLTSNNATSLFSDGLILTTPRLSTTYYSVAVGCPSTSSLWVFAYPTSTNQISFVVCSTSQNAVYYRGDNETPNNLYFNQDSTNTSYNSYSFYTGSFWTRFDKSRQTINCPYYETEVDGLVAYQNAVTNGYINNSDQIAVRPYIGDTVPQDVYIPDNEDVNYTPLPYVGGLDIPWDDTLFGDGTDTLTDAQSESISGVIDDSIVNSLEKTLTLADTENPDIPAPNEVYIPFLPVALPNFNFSLSGIWYYVREWISSLSAWFTMVLTVWSNLPYAMVVPVYATMVVLIVLGVYKRFFM